MRSQEEIATYKAEWQRQHRRKFAEDNGYSTATNYGGLRREVLERDGYKCVACGMTDIEHRAEWERPITLDHKDKNRKNNTMDNLQTLCLRCHGRKDLISQLRTQRIPKHRGYIMQRRAEGAPYRAIADELGFSTAGVFKWVRIWEQERRGGVNAN